MTTTLSAEERETIITMNDFDDYIEVYTCQSKIMRKLDKLCEKSPYYTLINQDEFSKTYKITKKSLVGFKSGINNRKPLTEEQRKEMGERLRRNITKHNKN